MMYSWFTDECKDVATVFYQIIKILYKYIYIFWNTEIVVWNISAVIVLLTYSYYLYKML